MSRFIEQLDSIKGSRAVRVGARFRTSAFGTLTGYVLAGVLLLAFASLSGSIVTSRFEAQVLIYGIAVIGLNVTLGYCGLVSVAQGAFVGLGAYASALTTAQWHIPWVLACIGTVAACGIAGGLIGMLATRIRTHYFIIVSIGLQITASTLLVNFSSVTGGAVGLLNIPDVQIGPWDASSLDQLLIVIVVLFLVGFYLAQQLRHSRDGRAMVALSQSSIGAESSGVNAPSYRSLGMAVGSMYAGLAGTLFGPFVGFLGPESFSINLSIIFIVMLVVGGIGSNYGAVVGVFVLELVNQATNQFLGLSTMIYGLAIMFFMVVAPVGLAGVVRAGARRIGMIGASRRPQFSALETEQDTEEEVKAVPSEA